jgi:ethanolamine utilization cobalamin adenosyltransferase
MLLPEYSMGTTYALLNLIRADIRELEVLAVDAFTRGDKIERTDVIEELNRMSSALHIMMMKYLSGEYNAK